MVNRPPKGMRRMMRDIMDGVRDESTKRRVRDREMNWIQ